MQVQKNLIIVQSSEAKNEGEKSTKNTKLMTNEKSVDQEDQAFLDKLERLKSQEKEANDAAEALRKNPSGGLSFTHLTNTDQDDSEIHDLEDSYDNLNDVVNVSPIPTSRINSIHPSTQILGDLKSIVQTQSKVNKSSRANAFVSYIQKQRRNNHKDFHHCLFACFLSQIEPKKISEALEDENLPHGKKVIGKKWVYKNKKDERGVVVRNKARIEAIRIFLAFASYMGFIVYQMDVKSAFLYGKIDEEVYVSQPLGFVDPKCPKKVYKVVKALYGLHQAPRAWYATLSTFLLKSGYRRGTIDKTLFIKKDKNDIMLVQVYVDDIIFGSTKRSWCDEFEALMKSRFQMSSMGELTFFLGLQVKQKEDGIFISQDKYVAEILKKFDFASVKTASTPIETQKPLVKDEEATDVDVHLYRSMIGSLMYLTASRPDIMFAVCACSRFQVTPKTSHLNAVKRIFRYLKGKPKLGLWYPRVSSFDLEAYSDSDYAGANLDRKSTTGGCQFLGRRLISWQCKKQTIVATSTTEAEYVAAANCCGQVLWIQNQMLDYGFNFMNTKIYIDNESTICIVKNPVFHSKTKHIEIRHHFIRDAYEKKLIQVLKIHTDDNVADLLTKAFDVSREITVVILVRERYPHGKDNLPRNDGIQFLGCAENQKNAILRVGILIDEAVRCGTLTKGSDKRKGVEESSKIGGSGKDNKKAKVWTGFMAMAPPINKTVGYYPRCSKCYTHHPENGTCIFSFNCQRSGYFAKDCRVPSRQVAPMNAVRMSNNPRVCYECGSPDHFHNTCPKMNRVPGQARNQLALEGSRNNRSNGNQVRGRAYNVNVNAMEAVQDPNIITGTFSLNDHFVTALFDSGVDFSFISTEFAPLLNVKPSIVNPGYVIEVADGKKVEVYRIIRDCKLELEKFC
ncbi:putative ribonuclease H-like domain-containing protein [Tanacetum coccineum]